MCRMRLIVLGLCLVLMTTGCRNRCNNPCGGGGLFAGGSQTIAPAPTYSLNIPSVARNQPYYTPNSGNTGTLSTYGRAPTPAARQAQQGQTGWRATGTDLSNSNQARPQSPNTNGNSVLAAPTTFVENRSNINTGFTNSQAKSVLANNQPAINNQSNVRTASTTALPGSGQSFTDSRNYTTTQVDERNDSSRLAVTDASAVRAPARNFPTGYSGGTAVAGYTNQIPQTYVASNVGYGQPVQGGYAANPMMVGGQVGYQTGYQGQPMMVAPGYPQQYQQYPTSSPPTVLAQSTATSTPGSSSTQLGWRDRDLTNGRTGRF